MNSKKIDDVDRYSNQIAYVMQDDILLGTFSPRETFWFIANLRLPKYTYEQKKKKVEEIIIELRLTKCSNTRIGDKMIRGISGGERKRTSIGVELLTDPGLLFLDEPTTGLDSSTSLLVVKILEDLSRKGVTVVSTIH